MSQTPAAAGAGVAGPTRDPAVAGSGQPTSCGLAVTTRNGTAEPGMVTVPGTGWASPPFTR